MALSTAAVGTIKGRADLSPLHSGTTVILSVTAMHAYQGLMLALNADARGGIALATMLSVSNLVWASRWFLVGLIFACALLALYATLRRELPERRRLVLLMPQQFLLVIVTSGAFWAVLRESYADGILRSWEFISADQVPLVALLVVHTRAILRRVEAA
jgi:hypothetical protein